MNNIKFDFVFDFAFYIVLDIALNNIALNNIVLDNIVKNNIAFDTILLL